MRHMKKHSIPPAVREMQIKTIMKYQIFALQLAKLKWLIISCTRKCREMGIVIH
jgi:hypothetical protein